MVELDLNVKVGINIRQLQYCWYNTSSFVQSNDMRRFDIIELVAIDLTITALCELKEASVILLGYLQCLIRL